MKAADHPVRVDTSGAAREKDVDQTVDAFGDVTVVLIGPVLAPPRLVPLSACCKQCNTFCLCLQTDGNSCCVVCYELWCCEL